MTSQAQLIVDLYLTKRVSESEKALQRLEARRASGAGGIARIWLKDGSEIWRHETGALSVQSMDGVAPSAALVRLNHLAAAGDVPAAEEAALREAELSRLLDGVE